MNAEEELKDIYNRLHPQVLSEFEENMPKYWGSKWKANTSIGKLRTVLVHRPGKEFLNVGTKTPWPPHEASLNAWRMTEKPNLDELVKHHENLVKAYKDNGVRVITRDPDDFLNATATNEIYTDD